MKTQQPKNKIKTLCGCYVVVVVVVVARMTTSHPFLKWIYFEE